MARAIRTEILIHAPAEAVWAVLTDFGAHAEWDPFLVGIQGQPAVGLVSGRSPPAVGERLSVRFRNGMTFRPTITEVHPARVLEWLGKLFFGGLFDGRHRFELVPDGDATRFVQSESFSGLLVPLFGKVLADTERDFGALNAALKERVEHAR